MIIQREIFTQIYRAKAAKTKKMNYLSFARTKDNSRSKIDDFQRETKRTINICLLPLAHRGVPCSLSPDNIWVSSLSPV